MRILHAGGRSEGLGAGGKSPRGRSIIMRVTRLLRLFWSEPRPATVPRNSLDWRLFFALEAIVLLEVAARDDLQFTSMSFLLTFGLTPTILWRRSHPLLMTGFAFMATGLFEATGLAMAWNLPEQNALAFLVVLVYALFRWGSGREGLLGLPIVLSSATLGLIRDDLSLGEFLGGIAVLLVPVAIGVAARYREAARIRELADARSNERLTLARELHDTVAHHVSAIAVRAQAGVATSKQDSKAALAALQVIQDEASRTLSEMREMVRVLRDNEEPEFAPTPEMEDLEGLAGSRPGQARVSLELCGETSMLSPALSRAVYRIAQESVTNAHRHARGATCILIQVTIDADSVRLRVQDDGELVTAWTNPGGYGLIGMAERAQLLGGTLEAGPASEGGWAVTVNLPHSGANFRS